VQSVVRLGMDHATTPGTGLPRSCAGERHDGDPAGSGSPTSAIGLAAARLRSAEQCRPDRVSAALGHTAERWRKREFAARRDTVAALAAVLGMARPLLDESFDALLEPVTGAALESLVATLPVTNRLFGFLMPGNVPGAGIHEICAALLAGGRLIIKPPSIEPLFFANFIRTLAEVDAAVAARATVVDFGRADRAAMRELWSCCDGGVVAYGDDATIAALAAARGARPLAGFGSRLSGALVIAGASPSAADSAADGLARDVTLFEQRGCLSPHHVFVVGSAGQARDFAARLARALDRLGRWLPSPARLPLGAAAAIRTIRERARWRALARRPGRDRDRDVALWEGERLGQTLSETPGETMTWTVVYDAAAPFCVSPGYRTVFVSALDSADELGERLGPATSRLEAFALDAPSDARDELEANLRLLGVSYICEPGRMQSPPLDWQHGGGALLELLRAAAR
jgi:hypothetical protein